MYKCYNVGFRVLGDVVGLIMVLIFYYFGFLLGFCINVGGWIGLLEFGVKLLFE